MRPRHTVLALVITCLASGCAGADDSGPAGGFERVDSAGVVIVTSDAPGWGPGEGWRVAAEPVLEIGSVDGDSSTFVYDVVDAVRLGDGRVVVAERSTNRILYFLPDGTLQRAVGGAGGGPGEYRALREIRRLPGDSLLAFDLVSSRVTILDGQGRTVRTLVLTGDGDSRPGVASVDRLADGGYLGAGGWSTGQIDAAAAPGLYRPLTAALQFGPDGSLDDTVAVYPGADMALLSVQGQTLRTLVLFSRIASAVIRNDELYVGTADSLEIRVYEASGRLARIQRGPARDLTITAGDLAAQQSAWRGDSDDPDVRAFFDAVFEAMPLPAHKPAFESLFVDPAGSAWLGPFAGRSESDGPWLVFGSDGRFLGPVEMPPSVEVLDIDRDGVLAIWRDELDVEFIRLFRIERNAGG